MENPILMLQSASQTNALVQFAPLIIVVVIFYLLIFMPMKKRQKETATMISSLQNGDKVITSSGIYGVIAGVKEKTFIIKISDQVKIEVAKNAVSGKQIPDENTGS
ncbi:MAG TPA: preprotein translocase subunit YajC [Acidobacteriota bacterium]|nr:preprotein translocase subunit YajC [Acidobacteriota bacterium]